MIETIKLTNVSHHYGKTPILENVSLDIPLAKWALRGKNGTGKSSFLRLLGKYEAPQIGAITYPDNIHRMSLASDCLVYPPVLTVSEIIKLYTQEGVISEQKAAAMSATLGLDAFYAISVDALSTGTLQKLRIIICLSSVAQFLLLDEPLTGLDSDSTLRVSDLINADERPMIIVDHEHRFDAHITGNLTLERGQCTIEK